MRRAIVAAGTIAVAVYVARWWYNYRNPADVAGKASLTREEKEIWADLEARLRA